MAKPSVSKKSKQPSVHSRAARRATDVDIDTDKSLKNVKAPSDSTDYRPSVLAAQTNAGISKKSKNRKTQMSAKAKKRNEKAMDRAEAIMERTTNKIEKSKGKSRRIQTRSKQWDDINKSLPAAKKFPDEEDLEVEGRKTRVAVLPADKEWETDEEMDGVDEDSASVAADAVQAAPTNDDIDEEIL
ncbi:Alb1-domain-containing protein [Colletotrichum navitas]|uniref:Alb1-domain-containing protein n=1 Tax=Colletotrichum navitas TaxID=681940 RepID=A0AAD8QB64_9PEZI|nr:Alb1-domain-containing protein [Colletotrichum navitas]KAK1599468.1 Alb1-domain-containing protein [Colletotrichum navitas]